MDTKTKQAQLKADSRIARCLSLPFLVETCANSMRQLPRCEHATHCGFHTVHTVFSQLLDETRGFWLPWYQHGHVSGLKTDGPLLKVLELAFRVVGAHRATAPMKALVAAVKSKDGKFPDPATTKQAEAEPLLLGDIQDTQALRVLKYVAVAGWTTDWWNICLEKDFSAMYLACLKCGACTAHSMTEPLRFHKCTGPSATAAKT